jgi:hypothetical protein
MLITNLALTQNTNDNNNDKNNDTIISNNQYLTGGYRLKIK